MKRLLFLCSALSLTTALAVVDRPDVRTLVGTGYHEGGWFAFQTTLHSDGGVLFDKTEKFILSPHYAASIRRIIVQVQCTSEEPTRCLRVRPFVEGLEVSTNEFDCAVLAPAAANADEFYGFDFTAQDAVDSFRLSIEGSGQKGNWRLKGICVIFGEKTSDEAEALRDFANELPTPENLRVEDFSATELHLAAEAVADAAGYRFEVRRMQGVPESVETENFEAMPNLSVAGWQLSSENAKFETTELSSYVDKKTASDACALKINRISDKSGIWVEILTREFPADVREVSYVTKAGSAGRSNRLIVYGRSRQDAAWAEVGRSDPITNKLTWVAHPVAAELHLRQVKFRVEAETGSFTTCGLDTLRVVYGGDESAASVETAEVYEEPVCVLSGLETARYTYSVQALGGTRHRDSSWTEPAVVDLQWADIRLDPMAAPTVEVKGDKLTVSWMAVPDAEHYLVTVVSAEDPDLEVVRERKVSGTSLAVTVPAVGSYTARVTAVSPCAKSTSTSAAVTCEVLLGALGKVTAEAVDRQTIRATWATVPLAESYQAKLVRLSGSQETDKPDFSGLPTNWPTGWEHYEFDRECYSGPVPKMKYSESWIATKAYPKPIAEVVYKFASRVSAQALLAEIPKTFVSVSYPGLNGNWIELWRHPVTTSSQTMTEVMPADVRANRLRFAVVYEGGHPDYRNGVNLEFTVLGVTFGDQTSEEVASASTTGGEVSFGGLDPSGAYQVKVTPQPSEDRSLEAASQAIDLSSVHFRETGAVSLRGLEHGLYREDFERLADMSSDQEVRKVPLDHWQFCKGAGAAEKLLYTVGTNRTTGGVYVYGAEEEGPNVRCLGTLATGSFGCAVGLAFRNDATCPAKVRALSFDAIQRSFRKNPSTYALEWQVSTGTTDIGASGEWHAVALPEVAPYVSETQEGRTEYRQSVTLTDALSEIKVPVGSALLLRWRQEKVASGPMLAIDDVRVEFDLTSRGFCLMVR